MQYQRVHLGCGTKFIPGWIHIDAQSYDHIDFQQTIDTLPMFTDNSIDEIYACHVLEHIGRRDFIRVLLEWNRVLKPAGTIRVSVPDWDAIIAEYQSSGGKNIHDVMGLVVGGQRDVWDFHCIIFNFMLLKQALEYCGFEKVSRYDSQTFLPADFDDYSQCYLPHMDKKGGRLMSLNVVATKVLLSNFKPAEILPYELQIISKHVYNTRESVKAQTPPLVITIGYLNFFRGFNESVILKLLVNKLKTYTNADQIHVMDAATAPLNKSFDLMIAGPYNRGGLNKVLQYKSKVKLFLASEELRRLGISENATHCDFAIGYVKNTPTQVHLPNWHFYWDFLEDDSKDLDTVLTYQPNLSDRSKKACFIARMAHGASRIQLVKSLQTVVATDCPGAVAKNMASVEEITGIRGDGNRAKQVFLKKYVFNLCPENAAIGNYVTEKIMQSAITGCIPIYWGDKKSYEMTNVLNPNRILWCQSNSSVGEATLKTIKTLLNDDEQLAQFIQQPIFQPNARTHIEDVRHRFNNLLKIIAARCC